MNDGLDLIFLLNNLKVLERTMSIRDNMADTGQEWESSPAWHYKFQ